MSQSITQRALLARINRTLRPEGDCVRACPERSRSRFHSLGRYYRIDFRRNFLVEAHLDLEACGRDLKVLRDDELLAS